MMKLERSDYYKVRIVVPYGEEEMKLEMDRAENSRVAGKDVKGVHLIITNNLRNYTFV